MPERIAYHALALPKLPDFPRPVVIRGRLYWRRADIANWARDLPVATADDEEALRQRLPGYREAANA
jgi:hypothetical protein